MIESKYLQPNKIEDYVLENNAMLQVVIHNQAYLIQFLSDIYTELHLERTGKTPKEGDRLYKERAALAMQKLEFYKETVGKIYAQNVANLKVNV